MNFNEKSLEIRPTFYFLFMINYILGCSFFKLKHLKVLDFLPITYTFDFCNQVQELNFYLSTST